MSLLLFHLIFVTLMLDDNVHPDVLKSTNRSSLTGVVNKSSPTGVVNRPHLLSNYIHFNLANSSFFTSSTVMPTCMVCMVHHVKHLEVIQDLQTIHVPIIK